MGILKKAFSWKLFQRKAPVVHHLEPADYQPFNSEYRFRGWVTSKEDRKVVALRVLHRGKAISVPIDESRPDVFEHFKDIPVNPDCGFRFELTEDDSNEVLTLQVQIEGSKRWLYLEQIRLLDQPVNYIGACRLHFDEILVNSEDSMYLLHGWIVPWGPFSVTDLSAMIDETELEIVKDIPRPDVLKKLGFEEEELLPGFEIELPRLAPETYLRLHAEIDNKYSLCFWEGLLGDIPRREIDHPLGIHVFADAVNYDMQHNLDACFHDFENPFKKKVVGWILHPEDSNAIQGVRVRYRNQISVAKYPVEREDVGKIFSQVPHGNQSGFEIEIERVKGDPYLVFDYQDSTGKWVEFGFRTLDQIYKLVHLEQKIDMKDSGVKHRLDVAQIGRAFGCQYVIIGWCLHLEDEPITAVRLRVNDRSFDADLQKKRPDVWEEHRETHKTAERSGFEIPVHGVKARDTLYLEYKTEDSDWVLFAEKPFHTMAKSHFFPFHKRRHDYSHWKKTYRKLLNYSEKEARSVFRKITNPPLISILLPTYNTPLQFLKKAIKSVLDQHYSNWELCIADDCSTDPELRKYLQGLSKKDSRIRLIMRTVNGHISAATQSAFELSTGDWITFLDHDDQLHPDALLRVAVEVGGNKDLSFVYSDEDKIKSNGVFADPFFKTDWDPFLLESQNYLCHLMALKRELYEEAGGVRVGYEGSQDWDLALRATSRLRPEQIKHIPYVLYHWREVEGSTALSLDQKNYIRESSAKVLSDYTKLKGIEAELLPAPHGHWNIRRKHHGKETKVSIIIPSRNKVDLLKTCLHSIHDFTTYRNYEIIVVDNQSDEKEAIDFLESIQGAGTRVIRYQKSFNFSDMNNVAARKAKGEVLVFLNNDVFIQSPSWLNDMVGLAMLDDVGAVGAQLLYPEFCIQHAGIVLGIGGVAGHAFKYFPGGSTGQRNRINVTRQVTAVTGACLAVQRNRFFQVGGFDHKHLKITLNDVDLCLKLRKEGFRNLMAPRVVMYHDESSTRGTDNTNELYAYEREYTMEKWEGLFQQDPAYNPNLTLKFEDYSFNFPPLLGKSRPAGNH